MESFPFLKGFGRPKSVFFKTPIQSRSEQMAFPDYLKNKVTVPSVDSFLEGRFTLGSHPTGIFLIFLNVGVSGNQVPSPGNIALRTPEKPKRGR